MITSLAPSSFLNGSPNVRRLFPNYREVEMAYYRKTGLFPIMHTIAIKREIYDKNQWIAASLMKAFEDARGIVIKILAINEFISNVPALASLASRRKLPLLRERPFRL